KLVGISGLGAPMGSMPGTVHVTPGMTAPGASKPSGEAGHAPEGSLAERLKPGMPPERILGDREIYTLHMDMPNLVSATGSWLLSFAELDEAEGPSVAHAPSHGLTGPVPLRKVDPRYPPALRESKIEGEVVLYAIIRKDGTVDSIELVRGVDPTLDQNAMDALAKWKFKPAERNGVPVALEAVVHIPFRLVAPQ
ncbi:MAG: energy transducer TonB, partial [Bryobacteraceae bacterium]